MCAIFYFWFRFVFIKVDVFAQQIAWSSSDCNRTRTHNHLVHKRRTLNHLAKLALNDGVVLWVLISTVHLTVCSYHVTYAFQSESALYSCLNVKELLPRSRHEIWSLSDCNCTRTRNTYKATHNFAPWPLIFKLTEVLKFSVICMNWNYRKTYLLANFLNFENQNFENVSFSQH